VLAWLLASPAADAAQNRWNGLTETVFRHITSEDGLPKGFYTSLAEDGDGFIWIGTSDGLARWDGYRTRIFRPDPNGAGAPGSIPAHFIQRLHIDQQGRLWIGTVSGGLARYDREHERFIPIASGQNGSSGLSNSTINAIADDGNGGIWVATDGGVDHVDPATGSVKHLQYNASEPDAIATGRITALMQTTDRTLWIGAANGVTWREPDGAGFHHLMLPGVRSNSEISTFLQATDGRIWIGTTKSGAFVFDPKSKRIQAIQEQGIADNQMPSEWISCITETRPGEIWLGTFGQGIIVIDSTSMQTRRIRHDPIIGASLDDDTVWAILRARSGLVWVATVRGVNHHAADQTAILSVFALGSHHASLSNPDVRALMTAADGRIWLGLGANGVKIVDPVGQNPLATATERIQTLDIDPSQPDTALQKGRIHVIQSASNGFVYLGTDQGLYRADLSGRHIKRMNTSQNIAAEGVTDLLQDGDRLITGGRDGLWTHDLLNNAVLPKRQLEGTEQLTDTRITALAHDTADTIWIGTRNGLNRLNTKTHTVERILPYSGDPRALAAGFISSLLTDRQGRLWVGTLGGGISILEGRDANGRAHFRQIGTTQGLPNPHVDMLLADHDGGIWVSTDDGLAVIDPVNFTVRALSRADGLAIDSYWADAGTVTAQGELLFGGKGGFSVVRPNAMHEWAYSPPLVITDIRIGGETIAAARMNGSANGRLDIPSDANSLAVEFAALDYSAPERNQYSYRMDGYDADWLNSDASRRLASYTNLPPGDYLLRVRGSNRNGIWAKEDLRLAIRVLPAWHQTWWCHLLALLAALLAVFALVQVRTRFLRQGQRQLEQQVDQRTAQLEQSRNALIALNRDLNHANTELARSADTLQELGDVGRNITASLDLETAFEALHQHVARLLDAPHLAIYRFQPDAAALILTFGRELGAIVPDHSIALDSIDSDAARAARERIEVIYDATPQNKADDTQPAHMSLAHSGMQSALFTPLIVEQQLLGVITIQSHHALAYGERECRIFRTLCAYGAIALSNADAHGELTAAHRKLQETQQQLVLQEKMAGLGTLTAGVAHEINNPTNFIHVAAQIQRIDITEFQQFVTGLIEADDAPEILQAFDQRFAKLSGNVTTMLNGTERIIGIVRDLRGFTRLDDVKKTSARLSECLTSTLNLVSTSWLEKVEFVTEFTDDPVLECWPALLNQVFMNLVVNACQAIDEKLQQNHNQELGQERGKLTLRLSVNQESGAVIIAFQDSGVGIAAAAKTRIMEPFYTTKAVGVGTGLGLSIAFGIIQKHGGSLDFTSTPGIGSCFTIILPKANPDGSA
jgi:signal transduction histidine kinase/ligand-binding sensor domain-containing protein